MLACQGLGRMRELQAANLFGGLAYVALATVLLPVGWLCLRLGQIENARAAFEESNRLFQMLGVPRYEKGWRRFRGHPFK